MELARVVALSIFSSYFLLILGLFCLIVTSLPKQATGNSKHAALAFSVLAIISFAHTWYYMFGYMVWSFRDFESALSITSTVPLDRLTDWLKGTDLFEQAWDIVCASPLNWWWSEQLCLFTVGAWTIFLSAQGQRYGVKHLWAYMLLGQVVAISVASNLFYLALSLSSPPSAAMKRTSLYAPPALWLSVLLSFVTIGLVPMTNDRTFLPNLLAMHALLVVPLFASAPSHSAKRSAFSMRIRTLYSLVTIVALIIRLRTIATTLSVIPRDMQSLKSLATIAWQVLHSHPAQSSIGWDVIWTTASFFTWKFIGPEATTDRAGDESLLGFKTLSLITETIVASAGVSAPEDWRKHEGDSVELKED